MVVKFKKSRAVHPDDADANSGAAFMKAHPLTSFFVLASIGYVPLVVFSGVYVAPGVSLFNLSAFLPAVVAVVLVARERGAAGAVELLRRAYDWKCIRSKWWLLPALLLYPSFVALQWMSARASGAEAPAPHFTMAMPIVFAIVFVAALGEELGWMGYVYEPLERRFGALGGALVLGVVWALMHIPLFSAGAASALFIAWQCIYIAATRVLFVWVFVNAGRSIALLALMHATFNIGWMAFPPSGGLLVPSFYEPRNLALTAIGTVIAILFVWNPRTLTR